MIPKTRDYPTAYIIEFKTSGFKTDDEKTGSDALDQIHEREYKTALTNAGVNEDRIIHLAITLQGKKLRIKR